MSRTEQVPLEFADPEKRKALTKKVLWKLDTHVLPALALVRSARLCARSLWRLTWPVALVSQLYRPFEHRERTVCSTQDSREVC